MAPRCCNKAKSRHKTNITTNKLNRVLETDLLDSYRGKVNFALKTVVPSLDYKGKDGPLVFTRSH